TNDAGQYRGGAFLQVVLGQQGHVGVAIAVITWPLDRFTRSLIGSRSDLGAALQPSLQPALIRQVVRGHQATLHPSCLPQRQHLVFQDVEKGQRRARRGGVAHAYYCLPANKSRITFSISTSSTVKSSTGSSWSK